MGHGLAEPFRVRVRDADGAPLEGITVRFTVTAGGGVLSDANVDPTGIALIDSDFDGRAKVFLTLGAAVGEHVVVVDLPDRPDVSPVTFVAQGGAASADIVVHIVDPDAFQIVSNSVLVDVSVSSTFAISSVTASLGPVVAPLTFNSNSGLSARYTASVPLQDAPLDTVLISVSATDVNGNETEVFRRIVHHPPATLSVLAPINHSVARPSIDLNIVCSDPPNGCTEVVVRHSDVIVAQGVTQVVGPVLLTGPGTHLRVRARDSYGQLLEAGLTIYAEPSSKLLEIVDAPGVVLDVVGQQMLFIDSTTHPARVKLRTIGGTAPDVVVLTVPTGSIDLYQDPTWGRIVPGGALVATVGDWRLNRRWLYVYGNGTLSTFSETSAMPVTVAGNWIAYHRPSGLYRRNLLTGLDELIPDGLAGSVVPDGRVFYQTNAPGPIKVFGASDLPVSGTAPRSDGTFVVYGSDGIRMFDGSNEHILAPARPGPVEPERDYAVNAGWIAFTRADATGRLQVWTRSPTGTLRQVTAFGSDSRIAALGSDGTVFVTNAARRHRATATGPLEDIMSLVPTVVWRDTRFVVLIGRMAYTVN